MQYIFLVFKLMKLINVKIGKMLDILNFSVIFEKLYVISYLYFYYIYMLLYF